MQGSYDTLLVATSFLIAVLASYAALELSFRTQNTQGLSKWLWLISGAIAAGTGIWSMHFVGMLAFTLPIPIGYDAWITFLSWCAPVLFSAFALAFVHKPTIKSWELGLSSLLMGFAIAGMHYLGMYAMRMSPPIQWNLLLVSISVVMAVSLSGVAIWVLRHLLMEKQANSNQLKIFIAVLLGTGIWTMHYTGMWAAGFPANSICLSADQLNSKFLPTFVTLPTLILLGISIGFSYYERKSSTSHAAEVEHLAYHDTLTGLPNRAMFSKLMQYELMQAHRPSGPLSLLFLDLDHFKYINDTMGHDVGDQLLIQVAQRLSTCLRRKDVVARMGGDEFVVLLSDQETNEYAGTVAKKILHVIAQPFQIQEHEFWVTVSIGISIYPQDGKDEQTLMKNADAAMYQAKSQGKNNYKFYSSQLSQSLLERMNLETDLRHALQREQFVLHYQGKYNKNGTISGVEALLRWQHPQLGLMQPAQFLDMAEMMGLTVALGKWVATTACAQLVEWQKLGFPRFKMAVNLTGRQFVDANLLQDLQEILNNTGVDPGLLELEIPQAVLLRDIDFSLQRLPALKELNLRIVVDDFGEGYSSLASLNIFPLDAISMPRSFMESSTYQCSQLAVAIIALGKALGLNVLAKGVENDVQAKFMQLQPCDELQGFYFHKPMDATEMENLLRVEALSSQA